MIGKAAMKLSIRRIATVAGLNGTILGFLLLGGCAAPMQFKSNPTLQYGSVEIHGDTVVYLGLYRSGRVRSKISHVNGLADGTLLLFHPDGTKELQTAYRKGKREGESIEYYANGTPSHSEFYVGDSSCSNRMVDFDSAGNRTTELSSHGDTLFKSIFRNGGEDTLKRPPQHIGEKEEQRSTEAILRILRVNTPNLRYVYNSHLANRRFRGTVTLRFAIQPDGSISYIFPMGDTTRNSRFAGDLADAVQDWAFPPVNSKAMDIVSVPFTFSE